MSRCIQCQTALSHHGDGPSLFEIDFARALLTGEYRADEEAASEALEELVQRFDVVAQHLLTARATNSELETSLKIARSNLALAEANAEALEETLRRRAPNLSAAAFPGAANGSTGPAGSSRMGTPDANLWGDPILISPHEHPSPGDEGPRAALAFWRRKRTPAPSALNANEGGSRSSTPNPAELPALPSSPVYDDDKADTSSTHRLSIQSNGVVDERALLHKRLDQLAQLLAHEREATKKLRNSHADLVVERDKLNSAHTELQGELEMLSAALFEEANRMVADERRRVAECEDEIDRLRAQVESIQQATDGNFEIDAPSPPEAEPRRLSSSSRRSRKASLRDFSSPIRMPSSLRALETSSLTPHLGSSPNADGSPLPMSATSSSSGHDGPKLTSSTLTSPDLSSSSHFDSSTDRPNAPGRQWLKSFNNRRMGPNARTNAIEDAFASIAADAALLSGASSSSTSQVTQRLLALDDNDLLPASVTPSPGISPGISPQPGQSRIDSDIEELTARQGPAPQQANMAPDPPSASKRSVRRTSVESSFMMSASRPTSYESWNTKSTTSSFASPGIETAFMRSPPLGRVRKSSRQSKRSQRAASLPRNADARSPPSNRRWSPPPVSVRASEEPSLDPMTDNGTMIPPRSDPLPHLATFESVSPRPARTSSAANSPSMSSTATHRERKARPAPLNFVTPPMPSSAQMAGPALDVRAPTPKSARRAGLVLGLDAASLFPHRGPLDNGLPSVLRSSSGGENELKSSAGASQAFARAVAPSKGVGLMKQVAVGPPSPMEDLDKLLDDLSTLKDELAFSPPRRM